MVSVLAIGVEFEGVVEGAAGKSGRRGGILWCSGEGPGRQVPRLCELDLRSHGGTSAVPLWIPAQDLLSAMLAGVCDGAGLDKRTYRRPEVLAKLVIHRIVRDFLVCVEHRFIAINRSVWGKSSATHVKHEQVANSSCFRVFLVMPIKIVCQLLRPIACSRLTVASGDRSSCLIECYAEPLYLYQGIPGRREVDSDIYRMRLVHDILRSNLRVAKNVFKKVGEGSPHLSFRIVSANEKPGTVVAFDPAVRERTALRGSGLAAPIVVEGFVKLNVMRYREQAGHSFDETRNLIFLIRSSKKELCSIFV